MEEEKNTMTKFPNINGVILAGGQGRRLGNIDKGLLCWRGKPLIEHVSERIAPQVNQLFINCNRNHDQYARLQFPLISDNYLGYQGPLAGVIAALEKSTSDLLLVVPCDCPKLPLDLVSKLLTNHKQQNKHLSVCHDGKQLQPLVMIIERYCLNNLKNWFKKGDRSVKAWLNTQPYNVIDFSSNIEGFINVNTAEDL